MVSLAAAAYSNESDTAGAAVRHSAQKPHATKCQFLRCPGATPERPNRALKPDPSQAWRSRRRKYDSNLLQGWGRHSAFQAFHHGLLRSKRPYDLASAGVAQHDCGIGEGRQQPAFCSPHDGSLALEWRTDLTRALTGLAEYGDVRRVPREKLFAPGAPGKFEAVAGGRLLGLESLGIQHRQADSAHGRHQRIFAGPTHFHRDGMRAGLQLGRTDHTAAG